ncbi:MAG: serine hydrolase domain-containing protein, partial [Variovorax sp.]
MARIQLVLSAIAISIGLGACGGGGDEGAGGGSDGGGYRVGEDGGAAADIVPGATPLISLSPDNLGDGWQVSTPDAQGINAAELQRRLDELRAGGSGGMDGIVVVRNDRLVAEAYFNGYARDTQHDMRSVTKSFTSAVAGIAIEQGLIALDDTLAQHIPRFAEFDNMDERKRSIRIANVLNMQSGLDCDDNRDSSPGNETYMYRRDDWIKYVMSVPMQAEPGTVTSYCSGA